MDYEEEINKLKFQIGIISETINNENYPIQSLVLSKNWGKNELDTLYDVFEEIQDEFENNKNSVQKLESLLKDKLGLHYQSVKSVILALYRNGQYQDICMIYAMKNMVLEFHEIKRDFDKHAKTIFEQIKKNLSNKFSGEKTIQEIFNDDKLWNNIDFGIRIPFTKEFIEKVNKGEFSLEVIGTSENPKFKCK